VFKGERGDQAIVRLANGEALAARAPVQLCGDLIGRQLPRFQDQGGPENLTHASELTLAPDPLQHLLEDDPRRRDFFPVVAGFETADQIRRLRRMSLLSDRPIPRDLSGEPV